MRDIASKPLLAERSVVRVVMFCHFIAAFAALGMPPFFALILKKSLHSEADYLAGWFYVVPTLFAALSSPWWGRLADRFGKKRLLIRAQVGLAASFLLAGFATQTWLFFIALVLQGLLGGTFSASNAYLATVANGTMLTKSLTAMQWSARAALVAAPACLGLLANIDSPIHLYRYLALLPLISAVLIAFLPSGGAPGRASNNESTEATTEAKEQQIYVLQFAFVFSTVVTFPYFISHVQQNFASISPGAAGLLFGLPHLVYLLIAMPLTHWIGKKQLLMCASGAFALLAISLGGQAWPLSLEWLIVFRLAMGIAMTIGFIALHALIAGVVKSGTAGRTFGWFESSSKWGGVGAGLSAGLAAAIAGSNAPFVVGAAAIAVAAVYAAILAKSPMRLKTIH